MVSRFSETIDRMRREICFCKRCFNVADGDFCSVCSNTHRQQRVICVVETIRDVIAIESTQQYNGTYHVLGGVISPLDGVGPDQLRIRELLSRIGERVDDVDITEVIIATDPNTEGEATATYLVRMLRDIPGLTVTRIASGLPMGGDLEFADELTLGRALTGRRAMA